MSNVLSIGSLFKLIIVLIIFGKVVANVLIVFEIAMIISKKIEKIIDLCHKHYIFPLFSPACFDK